MAKEELRSFFINLSGVILGILLTFGGNSLYQRFEEKKKTKEMLILVRNELQTNKQWFVEQENILREDSRVFKKILDAKNDFKSISRDTLEAWHFRTQYIGFNQLTTSAWQILQNSEMIQSMTDKELVIRLTDCYFWIDKIQKFLENDYWVGKLKTIPNEIDLYEYFEALMRSKDAVFFYYTMSKDDLPNWNLFPLIDAIIDYTINILDKRGDFQYDMEEKDKEVNSFIEARVDSVVQSRHIVQDENLEDNNQ